MTPREIAVYIISFCVAVAVALGGVILLAGGGSEPPSSEASPPGSPTPTSSPIPTEFDADAFNEGGEASECERDIELLRARSQEVAVKWMELNPDDSTAERQVRMRPYVVDGFFEANEEKLEVYTDSEADKARIRQQAIQSATPTKTEVSVYCASNVTDEAATEVPVSVWNKNPAGKDLKPPTDATVSITWKYQVTEWLATNISTT